MKVVQKINRDAEGYVNEISDEGRKQHFLFISIVCSFCVTLDDESGKCFI